MEMRRFTYITWLRHCSLLLLCVLCCIGAASQPNARKYTIKNGKMVIELGKKLAETTLDSFIVQFDLADLDLKTFIKTGWSDSLARLGWQLDRNTQEYFVISKPLEGFNKLDNPADKILFTDKKDEKGLLAPFSTTEVPFGVNEFKNKYDFSVHDSIVTFFLRGYLNAHQVVLSGSFINWSPTAWSMTKTDSGWIRQVKLSAGKHWYKFIVDGQWMVDKDNKRQENDGRGNVNSVYFKPNFTITLDTFVNASRVVLTGSFNDWNRNELVMKRTTKGWALSLFLPEGTHTYRFIVDGRWMIDPFNPNKMPNEYNDYNSVIKLGKPFVFKLDGYTDAKKVVLMGSFNDWRKDQLLMKRTATGWELPYNLGPGNYSYRYMIDGREAGATEKGGDLFFVIQPNYTFKLKGYTGAKNIYVAGDFNGWAPATFKMEKDADGWYLGVHLSPGKHLYKFVVDGKWILDPDNKQWEQNEENTGNSIIWLEPGGIW